jgi:uncharacterized membrane protein
MEGGSPVLEWITYAMVACVLLTLGFFAFRTATFFLSLLAIPITSVLGRRSRRVRRLLYRWGERGTAGLPGTTLGPEEEAALDEIMAAQRPKVPLVVRRGVVVGAGLGAVPGLWLALRGAQLELARGETLGTVVGTVAFALGLVAGAGVVVGGTLGAAAGLALDAVGHPDRPHPGAPPDAPGPRDHPDSLDPAA